MAGERNAAMIEACPVGRGQRNDQQKPSENQAPRRLSGGVDCSLPCRWWDRQRHHHARRSGMVSNPGPPILHAARWGVWSRLDDPLHHDGGGDLASLVDGRVSMEQHDHQAVSDPTGVELRLELSVFRQPPDRYRGGRDRDSGDHRHHHDLGIPDAGSDCRPTDDALHRMGWLRVGVEHRVLAIELTIPWCCPFSDHSPPPAQC